MSNTIQASDLAEMFSGAVYALVRNYVIVEGTVQAVDQENFTADVIVGNSDGSEGSTYFSCPLDILIDGSQAADVEFPTVGGDVLLGFRDGNLGRPQIVGIQQATTRLWTYSQTVFNGGTLGGMVRVIDMVSRMNLIENLLNQVIALYNGHTHPVSGAATGVPVVPETETLELTVRADIENTKITQ